MPFNGRLVSQLTMDDIQDLLDQVVEEGESLDYKLQPYGGTKPDGKSRYELCCDVVAFANTGLGYIIVGIDEKDRKPTKLRTIADPEPYMTSFRHTCTDGIEPRVIGLEVGSVQMQDGRHVIVIRIPPGQSGPHMVKLDKNTHFCRRYGDGKREMSYSEIKDLFVNDAHGLRLAEIDAKLDSIAQQGPPAPPANATDNASTTRDPDRIREIMELRMREAANR